MPGSFVVAQGTTPGGAANSAPLRTIKLAKPANGQAETIDLGYDQSVKLDFSGIGNERITLVHVGEKLVILYDNQATQTIQPFFDSMNVPLPGITVEVEAGRDVPSSEFATLFPISTDQSILPAAGNVGPPTSGGSFSNSAIDPLAAWGPLPLLGPESLPNFVTTQLPGAQSTAGPTSPSLQITKSVVSVTDTNQDGLIDAGDVIHYNVVVHNTGDATLTGLNVIDPLTGAPLATGVTLAVGATNTYTASYTITQADVDNHGVVDGRADNTITNTATAATDQTAPLSSSVDTPIDYRPALTISKAISNVTGGYNGLVDSAGDTIEYTITVKNTGDVSVTGVVLADVIEGGAPDVLKSPTGDTNNNGVLDVGEAWTFTTSYVSTAADLVSHGDGNDLIDNTATVTNDLNITQSASASIGLYYHPTGIGTASTTVHEAALDTVKDGLDLAVGLVTGSLGLASTAETAQSTALTFTAGSNPITAVAFGTNFAGIVVAGADPAATFSWEIVSGTLIGHVGSLSGPIGIELAIGGTTTAGSFGSVTPTLTATLTDSFPHSPGTGANTITVTGIEVVATDTGGDSASGPVSVAIVDDTPAIAALQDALMPYRIGTDVHGTWQPAYGADGQSATAAVGIAIAAGTYSGLTYTITDTGTNVSGHEVFKVTVTGGTSPYSFYEYSDYNATTQQAEMFAFTDLAHTTAFFELYANVDGAYGFHIDTNSLHYSSTTSFSALTGSDGNGNFLEVNTGNIGTFQNDPVITPSGTYPLIIDGFSTADSNPTHHNVFKDANGIGVDGGTLDTNETLTFRFLAEQSQVNIGIGKSGTGTIEHFQVTIWDSTHTISHSEDITLPSGQTLKIDAANWVGTGANTFFDFYSVDVTNVAAVAGEDTQVAIQSIQYDAMTTIAIANTALNFALSVTDGDGDVYTSSDNLTVSLFGTHAGTGYQLSGTTTPEVFAASAGRDTIIGGLGGGDTVDYSNSSSGVIVNLSGATDAIAAVVGATATGDVIRGIENIVGSNFADALTAYSGGSVLTGLDGADNLVGGNGADTFRYLATSESTVAAHDTIANFVHGSDLIDFSVIDGITQDASYSSSVPTSVAAHSVVYYQDGADTVVLVNASNAVVNNIVNADMMLVLTGLNANTLTSGDFHHT